MNELWSYRSLHEGGTQTQSRQLRQKVSELGNCANNHRGRVFLFSSSSLLKNLEMESFLVLAGRCWSGAVELDVIF
jgi:hypothetical protein